VRVRFPQWQLSGVCCIAAPHWPQLGVAAGKSLEGRICLGIPHAHAAQESAMSRTQEQISALQRNNDELEAIADDSALLAAIVESSDDAIVSKTLDGSIRSWNAAAERIFGYTAAEAVGKSITLIIPPELRDEERGILDRLRHGERIEHFETVRVAKDGRRLQISLTVSPVRNASGKIVAASKIARDISKSKSAEQALRQSEEALREASRRKDEFLATLAHELRNPLAPIRYAVAAMRKPGMSAQKREQAQDIIERQLEHMSRLLDDLLDVSRVVHNTLVLKKRRLELASVIGSAIETARPMLDAKHHVVTLDLPRQPVRLVADPVRLAQIFSNLLVNAAKYTAPGGRIELHAVQHGGFVVVSVRDNGIGMSDETIPQLFTIFTRARSVFELSEDGLGIGLALVRGLVALHGGTVEARSEGIGRGSEFIVSLPVAETTPAATLGAVGRAGNAPARSPLRILVVDDNRDGADSCTALLEACGYLVGTAYSGGQALELAGEFCPRVILLDIGMPVLNGYEVAQKIRAQAWGQDIVLVAMTGWGQEEDKQRAMAAGFDHHLIKPINPQELEALLQGIGADYSPGE